METGRRVKTLTTTRAHLGTQPVVSLPQWSVAENKIGTTRTWAMSSTIEMHPTWLKTGAKNEVASNESDAMKGTMIIMVPSTINLTGTIPWKEDLMKAGSKIALALELWAIRNWEVRWIHEPSRVAWGVLACHRSRWWGLIHDGKIFFSLSIIIGQDMATRTPHGVRPSMSLFSASAIRGTSYYNTINFQVFKICQDNAFT
jgi:hypothetical protein